MAHSDLDMDLTTFGKIRPLTIDDLRRYSAADLDPHTIQVGQILCKDFSFSSRGERNLATAFDSLPTGLNSQADFEIGYGSLHVIHSVLRSDEGFQLAAVVGALAEYFAADVVVEVLLQMSNKSGLPASWKPLEHQWSRMVQTLSGVLAASAFGLVLSNIEAASLIEHDSLSNLDTQQLLESLQQLNDKSQRSRRKIRAGAEAIWLAAISEWLYDLKTAIVSGSGSLLYSSHSSHREEDADVVIVLTQPSIQIEMQHLSLSENQIASSPVLGGRVGFEHLLRSCFGKAYTDLPNDLLAGLIYSASSIVRYKLDAERPGWEYEIFSQSTSSGQHVVSLADTLIAWFPELQRLGSRFRKYSKLSYEEAVAAFDKNYTEIRRTCACSYCISGGLDRGEAHPRPETCSATVAETIFRLSFVLARMFVAPRLLPKRHGIISFLRRYYAQTTPQERKKMLASTTPSDLLAPSVVGTFDKSVDMIKSAALIFANSSSPDIEAQEMLMGITHAGLTILVTGNKDLDTDREKHWKTSIQVTPGWLCLSGHEARLEVYVDVEGGLPYADTSSLRGKESEYEFKRVRQLLRWSGRKMCTTIVRANSDAEQRALQDGWYSLPGAADEEGGVCDNCQTHV